MIVDETAQLHELPAYWQERIRRLRSENHELRKRMTDAGTLIRMERRLTESRVSNGPDAGVELLRSVMILRVRDAKGETIR